MRPNEAQVRVLLAAIRSAADDLEHGVLDRDKKTRGSLTVLDLAKTKPRPTRDGYPSQSSIANIGVGGSGGQTEDGHDDPVGRIAEDSDNPLADPLWRSAQTALVGVLSAAASLRSAVNALVLMQPPIVVEPGWCLSHRRLDINEPVEEGRDLCWWCYDWKLNYGGNPPEGILRARSEGRRVTTKLVAQFGPTPSRGKKGRKGA